MIVKAFELAHKLHKGQYRKGEGRIPYIVHPMKVATILIKFKQPQYVVAAGFLHDIVEDTGFTLNELKKDFNKDVVRLVEMATELDHQKYSWKERKDHMINKVKDARKDEKILVCADKLANVTDMIYDYKRMKAEVWMQFIDHFPKEKDRDKLVEWYYQYSEWYYRSMLESLAAGKDSIKNTMIFKDYKRAINRLYKKKKKELTTQSSSSELSGS